jgi:hypothetical protein
MKGIRWLAMSDIGQTAAKTEEIFEPQMNTDETRKEANCLIRVLSVLIRG